MEGIPLLITPIAVLTNNLIKIKTQSSHLPSFRGGISVHKTDVLVFPKTLIISSSEFDKISSEEISTISEQIQTISE